MRWDLLQGRSLRWAGPKNYDARIITKENIAPRRLHFYKILQRTGEFPCELLYDPVNTSVGFPGHMKILAVDDNEMHCYALRKVLEHAGFEVCVAHNGSDALAMARDQKPDVVLLDINLPDVTGYEVCTLLKQDDSTRKIAVVFHSATVSTGPAKSYANKIGGSGFLTYPIEPEQLAMVLRGAAARASQARMS